MPRAKSKPKKKMPFSRTSKSITKEWNGTVAPGYKRDQYGRIVPKDAMDYARDRRKK